jgi:hypothetical protein
MNYKKEHLVFVVVIVWMLMFHVIAKDRIGWYNDHYDLPEIFKNDQLVYLLGWVGKLLLAYGFVKTIEECSDVRTRNHLYLLLVAVIFVSVYWYQCLLKNKDVEKSFQVSVLLGILVGLFGYFVYQTNKKHFYYFVPYFVCVLLEVWLAYLLRQSDKSVFN